jgi:ATP-dependent exoDNAse (exonuclease V) alpha subunit
MPPVGNVGIQRKAPGVWRRYMHTIELRINHRSNDPELLAFLKVCRTQQPSEVAVRHFTRGRKLADELSLELAQSIFSADKQTVVLTMTNRGAAEVNKLALQALAPGRRALGNVPIFDPKTTDVTGSLPLFRGALVMITLNQDKRKGVVNGKVGTVLNVTDKGIILLLASGGLATVCLCHCRQRGQLLKGFPVAGGYAMTIHKSQGLTLKSVVIYFDGQYVERGMGYVAVSRAQKASGVNFIGPVAARHFLPAAAEED